MCQQLCLTGATSSPESDAVLRYIYSQISLSDQMPVSCSKRRTARVQSYALGGTGPVSQSYGMSLLARLTGAEHCLTVLKRICYAIDELQWRLKAAPACIEAVLHRIQKRHMHVRSRAISHCSGTTTSFCGACHCRVLKPLMLTVRLRFEFGAQGVNVHLHMER